MTQTEAQTRQQLIDIQLARAGWGVNERNLVEEYVLRFSEDGADTLGLSDYVLLGRDQRPLAVIEAKRSGRDELAGKRQAEDYADEIQCRFGRAPFIVTPNGMTIQLRDRRNDQPGPPCR